MRVLGRTVVAVALALAATAAAGQDLQVTGSGPTGEVAEREQAREVRVTFSEPMVALGRIPADVPAPFFRIRPAVAGSFRWSGTSTLIFTPAEPLPFGTRFEVTVDGASALSGRRLARAHTFSFTTPTLRLLRASWYRQARRYDSPVVLLLRFNQPVSRDRLAGHLHVALQPHEWARPLMPPEGLARLGPDDVAAFEAKVARVQQTVAASSAVALVPAATWDTKAFPPSDDLLVWVTDGVPATDAWLRVQLDAGARGAQGGEPAGKAQELTVKLEPTFFVEGFRCQKACDPDDYNRCGCARRWRRRRSARRSWSATSPTRRPRRPCRVASRHRRPMRGTRWRRRPSRTSTRAASTAPATCPSKTPDSRCGRRAATR
jgi:hypothetical protein